MSDKLIYEKYLHLQILHTFAWNVHSFVCSPISGGGKVELKQKLGRGLSKLTLSAESS